MRKSAVLAGLGLACWIAAGQCAAAARAAGSHLDEVVMGDGASEQAHGLVADHSKVVAGGLGEEARELLPLTPEGIDGGSVSFRMKVDPEKQNYVTVKLWGSDKGEDRGRLLLFANGLQVGYRHEGDYDVLNECEAEGEAPGRFVYETVPLPPALTKGKETVELKIAGLGRMWAYGAKFSQYQKNFTEASRGIYRVYTHVEERFVPGASEKQGHFPEAAARTSPGEEVISQSREIVIGRLEKLLEKTIPAAEARDHRARNARLLLLAEAYNTAWTPAYHNEKAIEQIVQDGDATAGDFATKANYAAVDWTGAGPLGEAVMRVWPAIKGRMGETVAIGGKEMTRGEAWGKAFKESVDYWRTHRRSYTNQSMIVDRNIYTANKALSLIDPGEALPESKTLDFLYQAVGIEPWLGSDARENEKPVADAPDKGQSRPFGEHYSLVTKKGLSRELGWVGTYGETILHFMCDMVKLTGDEKIRAQLAKIENARMYFRYPGLDADGFTCMKLVSEIDNRTAHFPLSGGAYTAPGIREEWWTDIPALLKDDPIAVGAFQQGVADHQYFAYVAGRLKDPDTLGMMRNVEEYAAVKGLPKTGYRMPMCDGQPDFAFADEQDAVVAVKHGETRLFVNLYFRAERGVNRVARVYEMDPTMTRIATVRTQTKVDWSGKNYKRPDWIDWTRSKGMPPPGEEIHQAWAGEEMPIAKRPADAKYPAYGDWGPFLGKAELYQLRWGDCYIVMNSSESKAFAWKVPAGFEKSRDLVSGKGVGELAGKELQPLTTVVLWKEGGNG